MNINISNIDKFYPKEDKDFHKRIRREWKHLKDGKTEGKDCTASVLFLHLKTRRREPIKHTVLVLWLYLCIDRPWEKNWQYSLRKKVHDRIRERLKKSGTGSKFNIETLKKHISKKSFRGIVIAPIQFNQIMENFIPARDQFMEKVKRLDQNESVEWPRIFTKEHADFIHSIPRVHDYIRSQKFMGRRDLMRKFKINKAQCDLILETLRDDIKIKEWPTGSIGIWYRGP